MLVEFYGRYNPNFYVATYLFQMFRPLLRVEEAKPEKTNNVVSSCELRLHKKRGNEPLDKINRENELS